MQYIQVLATRVIGHQLAPTFGIKDFLRYIGPGLLVTVGFIDPGNWATNISAGAQFGYQLLWVVTLSTIMLIILQHNVAHLGIATGNCLSEAATQHLPKYLSRTILGTAMIASVATSFAEILGGAIALQMLFNIPIKIGAIIVVTTVLLILFLNNYRRIEKWVIGFVSIIGLSFIYELFLSDINWPVALKSSIVPSMPPQSILIIMGVLGAVVMPHNLFLHSEFIQSRQWNLEDEATIKKQLDYEFFDTLLAMIIGFVVNASMIILAATTFFQTNKSVSTLQDAHNLLIPLLGNSAGIVFAIALLCSGFSSTMTSALAGGSIFAGIFSEPFNIKDKHSRIGIFISLFVALVTIFFINNQFSALVYSQVLLSIQLPFTIFLQIYLTSSKKVMGKFANSTATKVILLFLGAIITYLNIQLLFFY